MNFNKGQFFIELPEFCHLSRLYYFDSGGMTPTIDFGAEEVVNSQGNSYTPRLIESTDNEMSQFILKYLKMDNNNFALIHDINLLKNDNNIRINEVKTAFEGQEVYFILAGSNSGDEVYKTFRASCYAWYSFVVLSSGELIHSDNFIKDNQKVISKNVRYIIASGYDGEGYVVWQSPILC